MTELAPRHARRIATALAGAVAVVLTFATGCDGPRIAPPPRARETLAYWEHFDRNSRFGTGLEALDWPAHPGPFRSRDVHAVLLDLADGEAMRGRIIQTMSGLRVEPELLAYAVQYGQHRRDVADLVSRFVELAKELEDLTGKPGLTAPVLRDFLQTGSPSGDGPLWEAIKQHGLRVGRRVTSLRERVESLERKAAGPRAELARLRTAEPELRAKLGAKYGAGFTPLTVLAENWRKPPTHLPLNEEETTGLLIGQTIGGLADGWVFESPQEFTALKVLAAEDRGDVLAEREVSVQLKGIRTGTERHYRLRATCGRFCTRWLLIKLEVLE